MMNGTPPFEIHSASEILAVKPYEGLLDRVTLGDPAGAHVDINVPSLSIDIFPGQRGGYDINLERCLTPAQALDWIFQVSGKAWMTPDLLSLVLLAFEITLDPQARLCSFGRPSQIRKNELPRIIESNLRKYVGWRDAGHAEPVAVTWGPVVREGEPS
jgi:hypothetical protein